jgi:RHS repeat-associated protein
VTTIGSSTPTYDANGNVTNDFLHTYTWNADGRPLTIDTLGVTYDALGRMVEHNPSGGYYEIVYAPTGEKLASTYGQTLNWAFISLPGGATAIYTSSGLDHYRHPDWLGSVRLTTTPSRTVVGDVAYAPYGEAYAQSGSTDLSFTGMDQGSVYNEYDFPAREYGIQGRWPSPDPAGLGAVDPANPQSWNRYAYALNNPLALTDPTGLFVGERGCDTWDASCDPCFWDPFACWDPCLFDDCGGGGGGGGGRPPTPPPHPPPAPPGGYGTGIDPYGTWDEELPGGVQVFPRIGLPIPGSSGCPFGGETCGGVFGFIYNGTGDTRIYTLPGFKISITVLEFLQEIGRPRSEPAPRRQSFTSCLTTELLRNFVGVGDLDPLYGTLLVHAAAYAAIKYGTSLVLPGPGWVYIGLAATWDVVQITRSVASCRK